MEIYVGCVNVTIQFQSSSWCSVRKWIERRSQFKVSNPSFFCRFNLFRFGCVFIFIYFFLRSFHSLARFFSLFLFIFVVWMFVLPAPYHCAHAFFIIHWLLNPTFPLFRFVNTCVAQSVIKWMSRSLFLFSIYLLCCAKLTLLTFNIITTPLIVRHPVPPPPATVTCVRCARRSSEKH